MAVAEADFKQALSSWASGVTIVTTATDEGVYGLTVSSFSSLSLDPQRILVCIQSGNHLERMVRESGHFGVSVLAEGQEAISSEFAVSGRDPLPVYAGTASAMTGSPLFEGALAHLDCTLDEIVEVGDHAILIGEPEHAVLHEDRRPLMYYQRAYRTFEGPG